MPATATGRGAQVVLDPVGDHAKAARGAYAASLELNVQKRRDNVNAGTTADGNTSNGRTNSGGKATDKVTTPGVGVNRMLNPPVAPVGNGANITVDTLQTFIIPAGTLRVVGDRIRAVAGGNLYRQHQQQVRRHASRASRHRLRPVQHRGKCHA